MTCSLVGRFGWVDDFAAARTYAHSLATGDVHAWIDLDDRLIGAEHLPIVAEEFARRPEVDVINAPHFWPGGQMVQRQRLMRAPVRWTGPVWEDPECAGETTFSSLVCWRHTDEGHHGSRDFDIAVRWAERDPDDWRPWAAAAIEAVYQLKDRYEVVAQYSERALELADVTGGMPVSRRALVLECWAVACLQLGDWRRSVQLAEQSIDVEPRPQSCVIVGTAALDRGDFTTALEWATKVYTLTPDEQVRSLAADLAAKARLAAAADDLQRSARYGVLSGMVGRQW